MKSQRLRILWIKTGFLHPLDLGGKLRTYHMLREMKKRHHITYLALMSPQIPLDWMERAEEYCHEEIGILWKETPKFTLAFYADLARNFLFSRLPYVIEKYRSSIMRERIKELANTNCDLIVCDFLTPAVNMNGTIKVPTLLFEHNVESEIWKRYYEAEMSAIKRGYYWLQWKRMYAFEKLTCSQFDGVVTVSQHDSETLGREFRLKNVLGDVPTGVDTEYFRPLERKRRKENHLVFIGAMDWIPNEEAVLYFVKEIYPRIRAQIPKVTFTVVGRNPSKKLLELQESDPSIHVTGTVADIRPYVATAAVMVVPIRVGGGTRIKIFEGMALGIPIVSTTVGAEGLPILHDKNILLADTPEDFAQMTILLLKNPSKGEEMSDLALQMVREHHCWSSVSLSFESYCFKLIEKKRGTKYEN